MSGSMTMTLGGVTKVVRRPSLRAQLIRVQCVQAGDVVGVVGRVVDRGGIALVLQVVCDGAHIDTAGPASILAGAQNNPRTTPPAPPLPTSACQCRFYSHACKAVPTGMSMPSWQQKSVVSSVSSTRDNASNCLVRRAVLCCHPSIVVLSVLTSDVEGQDLVSPCTIVSCSTGP